MKSVREHMDMHAAYREVGSYRAAAEICGTTPKTVKRSVLAARAAENGENPVVEHNYDAVRDVVIERVERTKGKMSVLVVDEETLRDRQTDRNYQPARKASG
jgi:hypothetical protein